MTFGGGYLMIGPNMQLIVRVNSSGRSRALGTKNLPV